MKPIVVLGSGLAGYTLVRELRKLDRDVAITLISQDSGNYYSKPMLSNALAQGKTAESLVITVAADMARQWGITLLHHTQVSGIRRARKELQTSAGVSGYGRLVLAVGADRIGLRPRIELARSAGLAVNRGIVVDAQLRSSDADIYALGDCAEIEGRVLPYVLPIMHAARALARGLAGEDAKVEFPAMPVVVKTPSHPVAVLPVARDAAGEWNILAQGSEIKPGVKLGFFDAQNQLSGFVLTGAYAAERSDMAKQLGVSGIQ